MRPAVTWKLTPSSAALLPNDRDSSLTSTTLSLIALSNFRRLEGGHSRHRGQTLAQHAQHVLRGEVQLVGLGKERIDSLLDDALPFVVCQGRGDVRDVSAGPPPLVNQACRFQLAVGLHDRVGSHFQLERQRPDWRKLLAGEEQAGRHQVFDLIEDLPVDWHAVAEADRDVHYPESF